jgi:hypothetical protein
LKKGSFFVNTSFSFSLSPFDSRPTLAAAAKNTASGLPRIERKEEWKKEWIGLDFGLSFLENELHG